ncbi:MAG: leucine-rich repeat domain-containing protein [Promethearchaeota archaeon]
MEINPSKIYEKYIKNELDKQSATELLLSLAEGSNNANIRVESIKKLGLLGSIGKNTYKFLEYLLISDSNEAVRNASALILKKLFLDKALEPMKWALIHEESTFCLKTIHKAVIEIINNLVKNQNHFTELQLLEEVKKIRKKDFRLGFELMCESKDIKAILKSELADILINYFTTLYLEKTYWRLKYKIEKCKITKLDFIFKGLTSIPKLIKNLSSLRVLILRYNQLVFLPNWISSLKSLESLNLNVNNLKCIPESIGDLKTLKELYLWKNELKEIPKSIGKLQNLQILNLRLNQLKNLPNTIGNLLSLRELDLHDNQLKEIPPSIQYLNKLEVLNLSCNFLKTLPRNLNFLNSLRILNLERNEIINLPKNIGDLLSLEILNVSDNKLETIPESIGNLKSLKYLNLSRNNLVTIPTSIESLYSLKELYLGDNEFQETQETLKILRNKGVQICL